MTDWHPDSDRLVALALSDLGGDEQEQLVAHLAQCPACREEYAEVEDGLQQALAATPAIAPSAGFSGRVLAAMEVAQPAVTRQPPRWWGWVAVAAAIGVLAGVGGTVAVTRSAPQPPPGTSAHQPVAAELRTSSGDVVGSAGVATLGGKAYLVLNVTSGKAGARYDCILVGRDGTRTNGGSWSLTDEYGSGTASGSWLVPIAGEPPTAVELVGATATVWAQARL